LKKQYYIYDFDIFNPPIHITLYHNGKYFCDKLIQPNKLDNFYIWAKENGYEEGYSKEEIHAAAEHYHFLLANAIEELNK
jgi:hypothetical protein